MTVIQTQDIALLGLVTVLAAYRMTNQARQVGKCRERFNLKPPITEGPEEFLRTYRAHQNYVEFFAPVMFVMWTAGIFLHQVPAAAGGLLYVYFRECYFWGYVEDANKRWKPFWRGVYTYLALIGMAVVGVLGTIVGLL